MSLPTAADLNPDIGASINEIETPALLVDLDTMEKNMNWYADFAADEEISLRSHTKTHKTPAIAHWQNDITNGGIICQTLSEVEVMADAGINDIYLSYMVVEESKLDRLVRLAKKLESFATTVDSPGNVDPLQLAAEKNDTIVNAVLEVDLGMHRVGAQLEDVVEMSEYINNQPNLCLEGLMAYEGHIDYENADKNEYEKRCTSAMDELELIVECVENVGINVPEVKVGSTPSSLYSGKHPIVDEINPGMFPFMDARLINAPHIKKNDCSVSVLTTVISDTVDNQVIVNAGSKSISFETDYTPIAKSDRYKSAIYHNASEEHGWIDTSNCRKKLAIGDRIEFIPPHVCPTINLHDTLIGTRDGIVEDIWSIQGRGKEK